MSEGKNLLWPDALRCSAASLGLRGSRSFDLVGGLPPQPRLAIVGSRAARRDSLAALPALVEAAGARGWSIVSGGALGCDGGAHRAALAAGVAQVAVLPCGRDRLYPPGHAELFAAMADAERACLLFAHPPGTPTVRAMFASRNAIIVELADAVLVAQAGLRSGSRGTGRLALRRGRPLAALAGSSGCGALIAAGAQALPQPPRTRDPRDPRLAELAHAFRAWLAALEGGEPEAIGPRWPEELAWPEAALLGAGPAGLCIDSLPEPGRALVGLCEAELRGLVAEAAPGRWVALVAPCPEPAAAGEGGGPGGGRSSSR